MNPKKGEEKNNPQNNFIATITNTDPNKAMLVSLFISIILTGSYFSLFILFSAVTYFIGSGWAAASLIMPFAIPLSVAVGSSIPLCVAAVIIGGTFGDVTSLVAGMTNMSSNVAHADHSKYLKYAGPYNFISAAIAGILFLEAGFIYH